MRARLKLTAISAALVAALAGCGENVHEQLESERAENARLAAQLASTQEAHAKLTGALAAYKQALAERDQALAERDQALAERDQALEKSSQERAENARLAAQLASTQEAHAKLTGALAAYKQALAESNQALEKSRSLVLQLSLLPATNYQPYNTDLGWMIERMKDRSERSEHQRFHMLWEGSGVVCARCGARL